MAAIPEVFDCADVTTAHLTGVSGELEFWGAGITMLRANDFSGLSSLEFLSLRSNSLRSLPPGVFRDLSSLKTLSLWDNSLQTLPENVFQGLDSLQFLDLADIQLHSLPEEIFRGLSSLDLLWLHENSLNALPQGAFRGLKALRWLDLSSNALSSLPGGVFDGLSGLADLELSSNPLLEEIGLRQSDGTGPDARYLETESLLLGSAQGAIHTLTVYDFEPGDQNPFCLSLWDGAPCSTVATLPHVFMGPLDESMARTELVVTHRDPQATDCEVVVLFHQGATPAPAVSFDGLFPDRNLHQATIPGGGAEFLTLTAPDAQEATVGAISVFARSPCTAGSLHVQGRALLENQVDGEVDELHALAGQSPGGLLADGDCRRWTGRFGNGDDVVLAVVPAQPGQAVPSGTQLHFRAFDLKRNLVGAPDSQEISGRHQAFSFGEFDRPTIIEMCLDVPGASPFQLAVSVLGIGTTGAKLQFSTGNLPGNSESEDTGSGP